jgi:hypothetical protein
MVNQFCNHCWLTILISRLDIAASRRRVDYSLRVLSVLCVDRLVSRHVSDLFTVHVGVLPVVREPC